MFVCGGTGQIFCFFNYRVSSSDYRVSGPNFAKLDGNQLFDNSKIANKEIIHQSINKHFQTILNTFKHSKTSLNSFKQILNIFKHS